MKITLILTLVAACMLGMGMAQFFEVPQESSGGLSIGGLGSGMTGLVLFLILLPLILSALRTSTTVVYGNFSR